MSWFQRLYQTYNNAVEASQDSEYSIAPLAHKYEKANIEIHLDEQALIEDIRILRLEEDTIVPITGDNNCNWGLAIRLNTYNKSYDDQLNEWAKKSKNNKVGIINQYIQRGTLLQDLKEKNIVVENQKKENDKKITYRIFKENTKVKYGEPFIRWIVGFDKDRNTWENEEIIKSWQDFMNSNNTKQGLCYITGKIMSLTEKHPYANGKNRLIASYDTKNFVFNGRFETAEEAVAIGYTVSQKAHDTLRWLMSKERNQAYINGEQKFVAWTSKLTELPKFTDGSDELLNENISGDVGYYFGKKLKEKIAGYNAHLEPNENTFILGIDNPNEGRTSVIYYRELLGSQFLANIEAWHNKYSWEQFFNDKYFIGAPSLDLIANYYLYNKEEKNKKQSLTNSQNKVKKRIIKDLIPTIIEGIDIPKYIENKYIKRASNPVALSLSQWETILRIACAIYKGNHYKKEGNYMCVDENNIDRSYLYGRLLAIIDDAELYVLRKRREDDDDNNEEKEKEKERLTNAKRFMNKFSLAPASTWKFLQEKFMQAYRAKIRGNWFEENIMEIISLNPDAFKSEDNSPLNGDYLLGYFCQLKLNKDKGIENLNKKEIKNDISK